ncbi:hypothetical protein MNBD_NITROSPINAE03-1613 [hydrothermal vent metagenome]|uniref:Permease often clustered with de novo purine synthesis n=1 Tax=hydrothermal vent metagenome TaxID=652676 RepID=A0A3B1CNQ5_9ZZZZ
MDNPWARISVKTAVASLCTGLFFWFIYLARAALFPFCVAFIIAYMLDPLIDRMESRKVNRSSAIVLLLVLLTLISVGAALFLAPLAVEQVAALGKKLPGYIDQMENKLAPVIGLIPDMDTQEVKARVREIASSLGDLPLKAVNAAARGLWSGLTGAMGVVVALFNLVLIPVATFYMLKDFDSITESVSRRIPAPYRDRLLGVFRNIDITLSAFFRGQLLIAMFMAALLSSGLFIIGIPMGIFIGIVAGLSNIVPYLPVFIGLAPALILAYLSFGDIEHIALVAALFASAQAIEGLYITPKVLEKAVGLHPVAVMASLLIGGAFFGFIGVVVAVPAAATIKVVLVELDSDYLKSDFYLGKKNRDESEK